MGTSKWCAVGLCLLMACGGEDEARDGGVGEPDGSAIDAGGGSPDGGPRVDAGGGTDAGPRPDSGPPPAESLAARYPNDEGIETDPAVVWYEPFEASDIDALTDRYESAREAGLSFVSDAPASSPGAQSVRMSAGGEFGTASDLYKRLPGDGYEQLFLRYYVKHEDAPYHHSGIRIGGYNPPSNWPQGGAGSRPSGDDRVSIGFEPIGSSPAGRRMDFYNYWMTMRSWMATPSGGPGEYYGNTLVHRNDVLMREGEWQCIEVMARLNPDPSSAAGGELALWIEDALIYHYTEEGPRGYWVRDKFCPSDADADSCLSYAPPESERERDVLDLQLRGSAELRFNYFWVMNYMSSGSGSLQYDDMVLATERVGCTR